MNDNFSDSNQNQPLFFNNSTSAQHQTPANPANNNNNNNNGNNNNNNNGSRNESGTAIAAISNTRTPTTSNSINGHEGQSNTQMNPSRNNNANLSASLPRSSHNTSTNSPNSLNHHASSIGDQHTINEVYSLIVQLQQQNSTNNQMLMKMNYMSELLEQIHQNLRDLNHQVMFAIQNSANGSGNGGAAGANMIHAMGGELGNQFKTFEIFSKHLNKLNKEMQEIANGRSSNLHGLKNQGQNSNQSSPQPQPQPQSQQQQQQQQQPPPPPPSSSSSQHQNGHPPLQSQHHHLTGSSSNAQQGVHSSHSNQPQGHNSGSFEDEVDLSRKNMVLRSPATGSNTTSPYVFELGSFPSRTNLNGNMMYDKSPMAQTQVPASLQQSKRGKQNKSSMASPATTQATSTQQSSSTQRLPLLQQPIQASQNSSSYPNSYMLPMPPLLSEDKGNMNDPSSQFMSNGNMMTSALRQHQSSHTRTLQAPASSSTFSFDDNDIDQSIDELEQQTGSSPSSHNASNSSHVQSDGKVYNPKRRKTSQEGLKPPAHATDAPQYKLERSLKALEDIWKEYAYGLNDKPPLKTLETKYGTKWRNETESRTFLRRKKIYEAIEIGKSKGYSEDEVIHELETYRSYDRNGTIKKKPLSWLSANMPEKFNNPATD